MNLNNNNEFLVFSSFREILNEPETPTNSIKLLPHILVKVGNTELIALVDSGCELSCINENTLQDLLSTNVTFPMLPVRSLNLRGAVGQKSYPIKQQVWLTINFDSVPVSFSHSFLVVKNLIRPLIIGIDWLYDTNVVLDFHNKHLVLSVEEQKYYISFNVNIHIVEKSAEIINSLPFCESPSIISLNSIISDLENEIHSRVEELVNLSTSEKEQFLSLMLRYKHLFSNTPGRTNKYCHEIKLYDDNPFVRRTYPIPFSRQKAVEKEINRMLSLGVIKRESTPYISPITVVMKKDDSVRICLDARYLNSKMIADCETPLAPEQILNSLSTIKYMSTIDLVASYWQIPLTANSTQYTGFLFQGKSYTFQVLPFGLKTAVGSFTRAMDNILGPELRDFVLNYIDDLLIASPSFPQHLLHLESLFKRLSEANITINFHKSKFLQSHIKYLGFILSEKGVSTDQDKTVAIRDFPKPSNQKQLRAFLGLCNFYRRFVSNYGHEIQPLLHLLKKGARWQWGENESHTFERIKQLFLNTVLLHFPNYNKPFYLQTDSSHFALGAELYQLNKDGEHDVLGFASRVLRGAELFYITSEKELLAIIYGLQKFRTIIFGYPLIIRTDNHSLKFLSQCRLLNDRLTRWVLYLSEFDYTVEYVKGSENVVADTLSRFPPTLTAINSIKDTEPIIASICEIKPIVAFWEADDIKLLLDPFKKLTNLQENDIFWGPLYKHLMGNKSIQLNPKQLRMLKNVTVYKSHLVLKMHKGNKTLLIIPETLLMKVIGSCHNFYGHIGANKLYSILHKLIFVSHLRQRIRAFTKSCDICQKSKYPNKYLLGTVHPIVSTYPGQLVTCDFYGPLPVSRGGVAYIFVIIDNFSKFVRLYSMRRALAKHAVDRVINDFHKIIHIEQIL